MPLPFLTADRAFDADAEDIALPFDDHDSWRRPYRPGPWRVAAAATLLLLASFVLLAAMIITFAGSLSGATVCFVVAGVVIACALRLLRVGAWVSLRRRTPGGLPPYDHRAVGGRRGGPHGAAAGEVARFPRTVQGQALIVVRKGGEPLAPLVTDHNADFLARAEAFERATDSVEAWGDEYRTG